MGETKYVAMIPAVSVKAYWDDKSAAVLGWTLDADGEVRPLVFAAAGPHVLDAAKVTYTTTQ